LQAHCQSRTSQRTDQSFVKELAKPTQDKIVFKKFPDPSKKIKNATHSRQTMTRKLNTDNGLQGRTTEHQPVTLSRIYKSPPKIFQRKPLSQPGF